jgi:hypothetical protein
MKKYESNMKLEDVCCAMMHLVRMHVPKRFRQQNWCKPYDLKMRQEQQELSKDVNPARIAAHHVKQIAGERR